MLSANDIVDRAVAMAGVPDPDVSSFHANLELLVESLKEEAALRDESWAVVATQLAEPLRNRIEVSDWVRRYPEIREERIEQPIFLTGLPRSGTTYFQYLFDPEPNMRMLRYWEGQRPCPPPGFAPDTIKNRIAECAAQKAKAKGDPLRAKIAQIHLSDADGPEECLKIIDQTFANVGHYWTYRVPGYFNRRLENVDMGAVYEHHRLVLQLLQWRGDKKRWVLKWPCHLVALDDIMDVYPDAKFVVTHRDPVQALASNCSLSAMLRRNTSDNVDLHEIGAQMKGMLNVYLDRLMDFDRRHPQRIAHVGYRTAVERPELAVSQALETLGMGMTPGFEEAIVAWRRANPPGKRGTHDYALEDYGLVAGEVASEFSMYIDRYEILSEQGARA